MWLAEMLSGIVAQLDRCSKSYPDDAIELHAKCRAVDFLARRDAAGKRRKGESLVDYTLRVYSCDLKRMSFLFGEYDAARCSKKNPFKPIIKHHGEPVDNGCVMLVDDCTPAERRINRRWHEKEEELCKYRSDCLHIAMKMLDIYIEHLWD